MWTDTGFLFRATPQRLRSLVYGGALSLTSEISDAPPQSFLFFLFFFSFLFFERSIFSRRQSSRRLSPEPVSISRAVSQAVSQSGAVPSFFSHVDPESSGLYRALPLTAGGGDVSHCEVFCSTMFSVLWSLSEIWAVIWCDVWSAHWGVIFQFCPGSLRIVSGSFCSFAFFSRCSRDSGSHSRGGRSIVRERQTYLQSSVVFVFKSLQNKWTVA